VHSTYVQPFFTGLVGKTNNTDQSNPYENKNCHGAIQNNNNKVHNHDHKMTYNAHTHTQKKTKY
jgi:hypothetical protein